MGEDESTMTIPNTMLIAIQEVKGQIDHSKPLEEKLLDAMKKIQNHWLITDEEEQFKCAIGAVLSKASEEDQEKINAELKALPLIYGDHNLPTELILSKIGDCQIGLQQIWKKAKQPLEPKGGFII